MIAAVHLQPGCFNRAINGPITNQCQAGNKTWLPSLTKGSSFNAEEQAQTKTNAQSFKETALMRETNGIEV